MPYGRGDYGMIRGDYGRVRGDPGLFGFIKKAVGTVGKTLGGFIPGPAGAIIKMAGGAIAPGVSKPLPRTVIAPQPSPRGFGGMFPPAVVTDARQMAPGPPFMLPGVRRRRMNYGNTKALRRADRRITGFVKVARSALRHTNYKLVSKSAGSRVRKGSCVGCGQNSKACVC